jgi:hypothetical protein
MQPADQAGADVTGARDLCLATRTEDGHTLICWKSPGHVDSKSAINREHYDPSAEKRWSDEEEKR